MSRTLSPLAEFGRRIRDWWGRLTTLRELDNCDARDLQRILHDLNVTEAELGDVVTRGAYPKLLLPEMLQAHGLRPEHLRAEHPAVEADLKRVCAQCAETKRCRRELDAHTAATGYREFCNNSTTLDALLTQAADEVKKQSQAKNSTASGSRG